MKTIENIQMEDLVYLKNTEMLYKYIVYRDSKKKYILESIKRNEYNVKTYDEFSKEDFEKNVVIDTLEAEKIVFDKLKYIEDLISKKKLEELDYEALNEKLEILKYELYNLKNIEDPTENQNKAIKNLEKAIRRHLQKIKHNENKYKRDKSEIIYKYNCEAENLKDILKVLKKHNKSLNKGV